MGATYRIKPGVDEILGLVLSGRSVEVTWVGNLEGSWYGDSEPLSNSKGTRVGNKLGISYGEVPGRSLSEFLWVAFVTKVGSCYGRSYGSDVGKLEG